MAEHKYFLKRTASRITFKRFVILLIITILALPILKSVFGMKTPETFVSGKYEYAFLRGNELSNNKILKVSINGVILTEATSIAGPFDFLQEGVTYGYDVKETLRRASEDDSVKGILLTINSPGGTIPGSQAISDGIAMYKQRTGHPVYAHIRDVGASGAYWAAVAADKVFVDSGSLVGSIGVILGPFTYYDGPIEEGSLLGSVLTERGIEHTYVTGGEFKDTGSPYRRLSPEERQHWQRSVDNEYSLFVNHVSQTRKLSPDFIRDTVKALPYDSIQAKQLKLVDEISNEERALDSLVDRAGLGDDYQLLYEKAKGDFISKLFTAVTHVKQPVVKSSTPSICSLCNTPLVLYDRTYSFATN